MIEAIILIVLLSAGLRISLWRMRAAGNPWYLYAVAACLIGLLYVFLKLIFP